jgi:hypothetical protein
MPINDNMVLSPHALETLYATSLYSIEEAENRLVSTSKPRRFHKKMTVATPVQVGDLQKTPGNIFLQGILQACRIDLKDVALAMPHQDNLDYQQLQETFGSSLVLLFGITPGDIGLPVYFPHFQLQEFSGVTYLSSPDLAILENDKLLKSKLWLCLKQYFSL